MRITRLEIFGFKSFVDRFVLNFDTELIGVVGPNGCGKSNIVDAIRWVLGETHAKQLRGDVLEDLIFSGSDSRRQLGMAEVTISIRPDDNWLEASENQDKEILELEEDSKPNLVVLDGGASSLNEESSNEDSSDESKEEDDTEADSSSDDTEKKSAPADRQLPDSVLSIPGLLSASEIQLTRRLYRSGESEYFINKAPCRLKDLIELYRAIGLGARGLSIVQQGQIGEIVRRKPKERRELLEEAAGIAGLRARLETSSRKLQKTSDNLERLKDIIAEVEKQVRSLDRQAKRAAKRKILKEELSLLESKHFYTKVSGIQKRKEELSVEEESLKEEISEVKNKLEAENSEQEARKNLLQAVETELLTERRKRDSLLSELNKTRKAESEIRVSVAKLEAEINSLSGSKEKFSFKKEEISNEKEESRQSISKLLSQIDSLKEKREGLESRLQEIEEAHSAEGSLSFSAELEDKISNLFSLLKQIKSEKAEKEKQLDNERSSFNSLERKIATLKGEKQSIESHLNNLSCLLELDSEETAENSNFELEGKVLLEGLLIPKELEPATSAVLGRSANFTLLSKDKLNNLLEASDSVSHGLIVDLIPNFTQNFHSSQGTRLIDSIEIEPGFDKIAELLLGNVFLSPSVSSACSLIEEISDPRCVAVTPDGSLVYPWGIQPSSSDSKSGAKGQHLGMKRRLEEINSLITDDEARLEEFSSNLSLRKNDLVALASQLTENDNLLASLHAEQRQSQEKQKAIKQEAVSKERELRNEIYNIKSSETKLSSEITFSEKTIVRLEGELENIDNEESRNESRVEELKALYGERSEQLKLNFEDPSSPQKREAEEVEELLLELDKNISQIETSFDSKRQDIYSFSEQIRELEQKSSSLKKKEDGFSLELEKLDMEFSMLQEDASERGVEFTSVEHDKEKIESAFIEAKESSFSFFISKLQTEVKDIKRKLEREGEVDPEVIERFEEESTRLEDLTKQYKDLDEARKTLAKTISELREVSNKRFYDAFDFVSKKFAEIVPQLFGGGSGSLHLEDPEDPLNSGVEMTVRPPGKKLQSIELMSGGEKALAATAIIMSMFLYRPSPICVLDEVDAPLDDANLERFLAIIKEISSTTQFLIITHNKISMAMANRLVGVTMEEKGVSKALEVDLEEAEKVVVNA